MPNQKEIELLTVKSNHGHENLGYCVVDVNWRNGIAADISCCDDMILDLVRRLTSPLIGHYRVKPASRQMGSQKRLGKVGDGDCSPAF